MIVFTVMITVIYTAYIKVAPYYIRHKLTGKLISSESSANSMLPLSVGKDCSLIQIKMGPDLRIEQIYHFSDIDSDTMSSEYLKEFDSHTYETSYERFSAQKQLRLFRKYGGVFVVSSVDKNKKGFSKVHVEFPMMKSHLSWNTKEMLSR